jgi:MFS family permease
VSALVDGQWSAAQKTMRDLVQQQTDASPIEPPDEDALVEKLRDCPVPHETIDGEVGQPLFTRTVTKAVAVGTAATAEAQEMPAVLKPTLGAVRKLTLLAYRLTKVNHGNRRALALTGLALAVGGFIPLLLGNVVAGIGGFVAVGAGVYLMLLVSWRGLHTFWTWVGVIATAIAIAIAVALTIDDVREWLLETPNAKRHQGWVSVHVLPRLRETSWHAPLVWILLVLLVVGIGAWIVSLRSRLKKAKAKAKAVAPVDS